MANLYIAVGHFITEQSNCERTEIAYFTHRQCAEQFIRTENDAVQAPMLELEEYPLFDKHGYPCTAREWFEIYR